MSATVNLGAVPGHLATLPMVSGVPYYNSGFLIGDLSEWRRRGVAQQARNCIRKFGSRLKLVDQDVINILFAREIKILPINFNLQSNLFFEYYWYFWTRRRVEVRGALHFSTKYKPWLPRSHHPYTHLYRRSQYLTSRDIGDKINIIETAKRFRNTFNALRITRRRVPSSELIESVYGISDAGKREG
jgi:lipopolysaccharide biosynthesis glycosyltransferase